MKKIIYIIFILLIYSCSHSEKQSEDNSTNINSNFSSSPNSNYNSSNSNFQNNYHTDPNYKYEYRTGSSGNYEYNYDISGSDENGNSVYGNIDIEGKYGSGYIEDEDGNEKSIDVEWVDYGVLEGTDEDGNTYEFEVDE